MHIMARSIAVCKHFCKHIKYKLEFTLNIEIKWQKCIKTFLVSTELHLINWFIHLFCKYQLLNNTKTHPGKLAQKARKKTLQIARKVNATKFYMHIEDSFGSWGDISNVISMQCMRRVWPNKTNNNILAIVKLVDSQLSTIE